MRESSPAAASSRGFTLVELLVSMVIVMIILAGLYSNVLMQSRVQASQASTVDAVEDLRISSQIMAGQLRLATNICWDSGNNRLVYQPLGASVTLTAATCGTLDPSWGAFQFSSGTSATGGTVCWDRPVVGGGCQEMLRGLDTATGFSVTPTSNASLTAMRTLTLVSQYKSVDRTNRDLQISFDVLPRNN
ncbi:MAG TPA: prepilin-type N-terminal cleavage/methylation domain-containing protein [Mariprofundaceae bacterium]|nr:prepilin-type N-terminal cleavage/methylation domain-containing protein [Mariprofundaceae bacterium]